MVTKIHLASESKRLSADEELPRIKRTVEDPSLCGKNHWYGCLGTAAENSSAAVSSCQFVSSNINAESSGNCQSAHLSPAHLPDIFLAV